MTDSKQKTTIRKIFSFIECRDNFLITAHMNADGDAYASMLAMAYLLDYMNKSYRLVLHDQKLENKYEYMWHHSEIESYNSEISYSFDAAIAVDVPSKLRMGNISEILPTSRNCLKIDHHPVEDNFADLQFVETGASSTSQLVFEILSHSDLEMNHDVATLLFSGIMYDTGRFSFSNTNYRDFEIGAELVKHDVHPHQNANKLFFENSFQSMKTVGYGLNNMENQLDGQLAIIFLPLEIMKVGNHAEIEELANYPVSIKGVEVGLFIREIHKNSFKVSFRSKGRLNVNKIAQQFDGGGHDHAAGCRYDGNYEELHRKLIEAVRKAL